MAMCTSMLLGDPPPALVTPLLPPHHSAVATINEVIRYHVPYWRSLRIDGESRISFIRFKQNLFCSTPGPGSIVDSTKAALHDLQLEIIFIYRLLGLSVYPLSEIWLSPFKPALF